MKIRLRVPEGNDRYVSLGAISLDSVGPWKMAALRQLETFSQLGYRLDLHARELGWITLQLADLAS